MGESEARLILPVGGAPLSLRMAAAAKATAVEVASAAETMAETVAEPSPVTPDEDEATAPSDGPDDGPDDGPAVAATEMPAEGAIRQTPAVVEPEAETSSTPGYFIPPHIFVDVAPESTIAQEEIFGPVLVVLKAHKFGQALEMALAVRYGLTGGLYSRNPNHIRRAVRDYRVGNLYINRPVTGAMVGRQPFGGSRMSGVGSKAGGPDHLLQFMEPRTITENTIRRGFAPAPEDAA